MARQICHITSVPYPSAQAWFVNVLHELGIMIFDESPAWTMSMTPKSRECWVQLRDGTWEVNEEWRMKGLGIIPGLQERTSYRFDDDIAVGASHRLDFMRDPNTKVLVVVRDPRDCLYSAIFRNPVYIERLEKLGDEQGLPAFLSSPMGSDNDTLVDATLFSHIHHWMFYMGYCELMSRSANVRFFRMEDCKRDPLGTARAMLDFFGKQRSEEQIMRAIERSGVERFRIENVKEFADRYYKNTKPLTNARRGIPEEWRERRIEGERRLYEGYPATFLKHFGYDPDGMRCEGSLDDFFESRDQSVERLRSWVMEEQRFMSVRRPSIDESMQADAARLACLWAVSFTHSGPSTSPHSLAAFSYGSRFLEKFGNFDRYERAELVRKLYQRHRGSGVFEIAAMSTSMERPLHP